MHVQLLNLRRPEMCDAGGFLMQRSPDDVESARFPENASMKNVWIV